MLLSVAMFDLRPPRWPWLGMELGFETEGRRGRFRRRACGAVNTVTMVSLVTKGTGKKERNLEHRCWDSYSDYKLLRLKEMQDIDARQNSNETTLSVTVPINNTVSHYYTTTTATTFVCLLE
jgi:hypothetical protein